MIATGDVLPLTIEKPAVGGRMLARAGRLVVLVSGAIPGERVRAKVERVGKGVAYAAAVEVDESSPDRRSPAGDPLCGGCLYAHIAYLRQLEIKSLVIADAFMRIGHISLPDAVRVVSSGEQGYRMRARLHVRGGLLGFLREGTHDVCGVRQTGQLLSATCDVLDHLAAEIRSLGGADPQEIEVAENVDASDRVVALGGSTVTEALLDRLWATDGLTGLSSVRGTRGETRVTDILTIDGHPISLRRHVLAFFQGNRYLLERLVAHVVEQVPSQGEVIDLYAGVGLFSVAAAAARGARVTAVEGDGVAAADLAVNASVANGAIVALHRPVEAFVAFGRGSSGRVGGRVFSGRQDGRQADHDGHGSTLILDPPRTGMSHEALDGVIRLSAERVVYVSCDVATLARDVRRLLDAGYVLTRADAFDLFPNTPHVETVVVLDWPR